MACKLEGFVWNIGIYVCGVVIILDDIICYVLVIVDKDIGMFVFQFDNSVVEDVGLFKMDFFGLKILIIIKKVVVMVEWNYDVKFDMDMILLDDFKIYEFFQCGEMVGIFQYEFVGMQKYMKEFKFIVFEDFIVMNVFYCFGLLEYILEFIDCKYGCKLVIYDLFDMKEYLEEIYGIMVYQEQVMLFL